MIGGLKTTSRYLLAGASLIGILAFNAPEASAQNLQEIQAQIDAMQATIKALQKQVQDAKAEAAAATTAAASAGGSDLDLKVKWKGAPNSRAATERNSSSRSAGVSTRTTTPSIRTKTSPADLTSARPRLRRARLGVEGVLWYDVKYLVEVDFANDVVALKDAYTEYTGLEDRRRATRLRASATSRRPTRSTS